MHKHPMSVHVCSVTVRNGLSMMYSLSRSKTLTLAVSRAGVQASMHYATRISVYTVDSLELSD